MKQERCITCGQLINVKKDLLKYRCPKCKTEYEYAEIIQNKESEDNAILLP